MSMNFATNVLPAQDGGYNLGDTSSAWNNTFVKELTLNGCKMFYGVCNTAAATVAKEVTCANFTSANLTTGVVVWVNFTNTNSGAVADLTLNVNGTGAIGMKKIYNAAIANIHAAGELQAGVTLPFTYNGTNWVLISSDYNNTYTVYNARQTLNSDAKLRPLLISSRETSDTTTNRDAVTYRNNTIYAQTSTSTIFASAFNGVALTSATTGFTISGGSTTSKTLTVPETYTLGSACAKTATDRSSATAISNATTATTLLTERAIYYGLPNINDVHTYNSGTYYYVPASKGATNQVFIGGGSNVPAWGQIGNSQIASNAAIDIDKLQYSSISIGNQSVALGGTVDTNELVLDLGLNTPFEYKGVLNAKPTSGSGYSSGDIVIVEGTQNDDGIWAYNGTSWTKLGPSATYKLLQNSVADPTASGTATSFISTISQDTNGVITATKANVTVSTVVSVSVTNTSGNYSNVFTGLSGVTAAMKPVNIEFTDASVFRDKITVTPGDGSLTIQCNDVVGTSTVTITLIN